VSGGRAAPPGPLRAGEAGHAGGSARSMAGAAGRGGRVPDAGPAGPRAGAGGRARGASLFPMRSRCPRAPGQSLSAQVADEPYEPPCNKKNLCNRPRQCYVCTDAEYEVAANGYGQCIRAPARLRARTPPRARLAQQWDGV